MINIIVIETNFKTENSIKIFFIKKKIDQIRFVRTLISKWIKNISHFLQGPDDCPQGKFRDNCPLDECLPGWLSPGKLPPRINASEENCSPWQLPPRMIAPGLLLLDIYPKDNCSRVKSPFGWSATYIIAPRTNCPE